MVLLVTSISAQMNAAAHHYVWNSKTFVELNYKHTIESSKDLSAAERSALVGAISALLRPFMADLEIGSESELRNIASQSRYRFIDLNDDRVPEVIVQPVGLKTGCGATGNCPFWVFVKTAQGYKAILDTRDKDGIGGVELYRVEPTMSNAYHDISVVTHDTVSQKTVYIYSFIRNKYQAVHCYSLSWTPPDGIKEWRFHKMPLITTCN